MGKYIIEVDDKYVSPDNVLIVSHKNLFDGCSYHVQTAKLTPYTEPDIDAIRNETWEVARKIGSNSMCSLEEMGFDFSQCVVNDYNPSWFVIKNYSASECIEKIRAYEQEKKGEIKVGDEVIAPLGVAVITEITDERFHFIHADGSYGFDYKRDAPRKTGRHFPEIAAVLEKMRESE